MNIFRRAHDNDEDVNCVPNSAVVRRQALKMSKIDVQRR